MAAPDEGDAGGIHVGVLYTVAVFGGLLATGAVVPWLVLGAWDAAYFDARPGAIPPEVYLYAYLGATVYLLIALYRNPRPSKPAAVGLLFRIPAALLLVTGVYLLASVLDLGPVAGAPQGLHGVAFVAYLTGLFVEGALRSVGTVASRLYPGDPTELLLTDATRRSGPADGRRPVDPVEETPGPGTASD